MQWRMSALVLRYTSTTMVLVGLDGRVVWGNRAARRLFAESRLRGVSLPGLIEDPEAAALFLESAASNEPGYVS